jgi:hypothetical protein
VRAGGGVLRAGLWLAAGLLLGLAAAPHASARQEPPVPVLAYYYIWYQPSSWNRAKTDYPLAGRYSSDDTHVMRQHVRWAREAGLAGFIVSWKSTPVLDARLARLAAIARSQRFKLVIIYQGLDFHRNPLPVARVRADLQRFARRYGHDPAFDLYGRPLVIWGGTWRFTRAAVAKVSRALGDDLLLLASARTLGGYRRIAPYVDGNAYYWSSVDPYEHDRYRERLAEMGAAVHRRGGLWIAPAAPGFDARRIGGRRVVPRRDGETLRREWDAALASVPDAVGLISWNEFSENSQVEPSRRHGGRYLQILASLLGARAPAVEQFDSSQPGNVTDVAYGLPVLGGFSLLLVCGGAAVARRRRRAHRAQVQAAHALGGRAAHVPRRRR